MKKTFIFLFFISCIGALAVFFHNPYTHNPPVRYFDGRCFYNEDSTATHTLFDVAKLFFVHEYGLWPETKHPVTPRIPESVPPRTQITYVGHATFLIQIAGLNILTDPIWSEKAGPFSMIGPQRIVDPGIAFQQLPKIDYVLVSHNHYDHLDGATLSHLILRDDPMIVTFYGNGSIIKSFHRQARVVELGWWNDVHIEQASVTITGCPAHHWSARGVLDRNKALWGGFMVTAAQHKIYFAGDTAYSYNHCRQIKQKLGSPDVALLPIGAYTPRWFMKNSHMSPQDAVRAHQLLDARLSIGMHFDVFPMSDEAYQQPLADLSIACALSNVHSEKFVTLNPGHYIELSAP